MVDRSQLENALKIALDDFVINDENITKDEIDDVSNEFLRLANMLKKEASESDDEDDEDDEGEVDADEEP